jgi:multiple sugar transport system permease protein
MTRAQKFNNLVFKTYVPLIPFLIFALFPYLWMVVSSLKGDVELYDVTANPFLIREGVVFEHYRALIEETNFIQWMFNSVQVSSLSTFVSVTISIIAAYALVRLKFPGAAVLAVAIFVTYLVPRSLLFLPLTQIIHWLRLDDTKWSLVVAYPTFLVPFSTWMLMGYFKGIPREIEEAALIDGCGRIKSLIRILIPISIPGIVCATLFSFTLSWNEFIYALTFVSSSENKMAPIAVVGELIRGDIYFWGSLMAGAVLASVPIVIVYVFFLDYYISGLTAGAVK